MFEESWRTVEVFRPSASCCRRHHRRLPDALVRAAVDDLAAVGDELPVVAGRVQGELEIPKWAIAASVPCRASRPAAWLMPPVPTTNSSIPFALGVPFRSNFAIRW